MKLFFKNFLIHSFIQKISNDFLQIKREIFQIHPSSVVWFSFFSHRAQFSCRNRSCGMKIVLSLLLLCAYVAAAKTHSKNKIERSVRASSPTFVLHWRSNPPAGYQVATFADFTSPLFANQYNINDGFSYDTNDGGVGGACGFAVMEGFLMFPKNDTANAQEVTFSTSTGKISCRADLSVGINGLVATMPDFGCGSYPNLVFQHPVSQTFFLDNCFVVTTTCEFSKGQNSYTLFINNAATPSPSPTPSSVSPSFLCCGYYDFEEHFESDFCQLAGKMCPDIDGYTAVGNYTTSSCDECCGTERKLFIQN